MLERDSICCQEKFHVFLVWPRKLSRNSAILSDRNVQIEWALVKVAKLRDRVTGR